MTIILPCQGIKYDKIKLYLNTIFNIIDSKNIINQAMNICI